MKNLISIIHITLRLAFRSHIAQIGLALLLCIATLLPLYITSDSTLTSEFQLDLSYSLHILNILLSIMTLWLGVTIIGQDIENYKIHMIVSKPISRSTLWLGKCLGIIIMQGTLLGITATILIMSVFYFLKKSNYPQEEWRTLSNEILKARQIYKADKQSMEGRIQEEYKKRLQQGHLDNSDNDPHRKSELLDAIRQEFSRQQEEITFAQEKRWRFSHLPEGEEEEDIYLQFRIYGDNITVSDQEDIIGSWTIKNPQDNNLRRYPWKGISGVVHKLGVSSALISAGGKLDISYLNQSPFKKSVLLQTVDGPYLLIHQASFWRNYIHTILFIFAQITFLSLLSCAVGACFSIPVGIFVSFSYFLIAFLLFFSLPKAHHSHSGEKDDTLFLRAIHTVHITAKFVFTPIHESSNIRKLIHGTFIDTRTLVYAIFKLIFYQGFPVAILGIYFFNKRELGMVIKN